MRILIAAASFLIASNASALADSAEANWTGYYIGVGAGKSYSESEVKYAHNTDTCSNNNYGSDAGGGCGGTQNYAESLTHDMDDKTGAIHAGYNWQMEGLVLGIEPMVMIKQQDKNRHEIISSAFGDTLDIRTEQSYTASVRATIGMPIDSMLLYATGGPSIGRTKTSITQLAIGTTQRVFHETDTQLGYTVGGGVKYRLSQHWALGGELLYTDLGTTTTRAPVLVMPGGLTYPVTHVRTRNSSTTALVNLSYYF